MTAQRAKAGMTSTVCRAIALQRRSLGLVEPEAVVPALLACIGRYCGASSLFTAAVAAMASSGSGDWGMRLNSVQPAAA